MNIERKENFDLHLTFDLTLIKLKLNLTDLLMYSEKS